MHLDILSIPGKRCPLQNTKHITGHPVLSVIWIHDDHTSEINELLLLIGVMLLQTVSINYHCKKQYIWHLI